MPIALGAAAPRERAQRTQATTERSTKEETLAADWDSFLETGSLGARNRLVAHYMRTLVRPIARRIHGGLPHCVDADDLVQQGYFGLIGAMSRYDATRKFDTYARTCIFGSIQDYLRSIDHVPRLTRARSKKVAAAQDEFRVRNGRKPTLDELRPMTDVPENVLQRLFTEGRPAGMIAFSSVSPESDESGEFEADGMDAFRDHHEGPDTHALRQDIRDFVTSGFDRRDRLIVILYYYENMTMREVGQSLGICESRVSQRLDSIHGCLRARLQRAGCEELLPSA